MRMRALFQALVPWANPGVVEGMHGGSLRHWIEHADACAVPGAGAVGEPGNRGGHAWGY